MKLIILFICLPLSLFSQPKHDSLGKYSYPVFVFANEYLINGTGFFYKKSESLYLITAMHVVSGYDSVGNKPNYSSDSLNIIIKDLGAYLRLNISHMLDKHNYNYKKENADICVIKVPDSWDKYVNTVNNLTSPKYINNEDIVIYGYPKEKLIEKISGNTMKLNDKESVLIFPFNTFIRTVDSVNTLIMDLFPNYHKGEFGGYSGSPTYSFDKTTNKWVILGLLSSNSSDNYGSLYFRVPLIEQAIKMIDNNQYFLPTESK